MAAPPRDIVVLGGSAGALLAARTVLSGLPSDCPASVFVSFHREPVSRRPDPLLRALSSGMQVPVLSAQDEEAFESGRVYVAPADQHMVLENGVIRLQHSPKEHRFRPSVDALFKSAAATYGRRVVGVLLSGGFGNDGSAGLWQIKHRGGVAIVQDPGEAQHAAMPQAAIDSVAADHVLNIAEIGPKLMELMTQPSGEELSPRPRILVVYNESIAAAELQEGLSAMGYDTVDWVSSGEAAIEIAARERPDLIVMDVHLSGILDGIEAARRIWQTQQIPVVFCTAHADADTMKAVGTTEMYGHVIQPFHSEGVRAAIELALARREKEGR